MKFAIFVHLEFVGDTVTAPERIEPPGFTAEEVELIYRGIDLSDLENRL